MAQLNNIISHVVQLKKSSSGNIKSADVNRSMLGSICAVGGGSFRLKKVVPGTPTEEGSDNNLRRAFYLKALEDNIIDGGTLAIPISEISYGDQRLWNIYTWDFNVTVFGEDRSILCAIVMQLIESMFCLKDIKISRHALAKFVEEMSSKYHQDNPFHNFIHASSVTHIVFKLFEETKAFDYVAKQQLFATMIAAVGHDADHPGNTNLFEINSESDLAILYNDTSVLENHHAATLCKIIRKKDINLFGQLATVDYKDVKKTIIMCILATDMTKHFSQVAEIEAKIAAKWELPLYPGVSMTEESLFYCKLMVHAADLSNAVRPFEIAKYWGFKIAEEFNLQVESEERLGLPVLNFMISRNKKQICENEIGFSTNVVAPMWHAIARLWPPLKHLEDQLLNNYSLWREQVEQHIIKPTKKAMKLL